MGLDLGERWRPRKSVVRDSEQRPRGLGTSGRIKLDAVDNLLDRLLDGKTEHQQALVPMAAE